MAAPNWSWSVGPWRAGVSAVPALVGIGGPAAALRNAAGRSLRLRLLEPSDATFTVPGSSAEAALLEELITDLWVYRNGTSVFRGRVMSTRDTVDQRHDTAVQVGDYRSVLDRRIRWTDRTWTGVEQSTIAWNAITDTQADPGGDIGLAQGTWPTTGVTRASVTMAAGDSVWGLIKRLGGMNGGFEFDIDANLTANLYYPRRGSDVGTTLDYGGLLDKVDRVFDAARYANSIRQSGADGVAVTTATTTDIATAPEGRWDAQFGDTQLTTSDMVAQTAAANLLLASMPLPSYSVRFARGRWLGPSHVWLGDYVSVVVKSGRLNERITSRVYEIGVDVDANNQETVTAVVGDVRFDRARTLRGIARRLVALAIR